MEEDLKKMSSEHPVRTCNDIKLEKPLASSGFFTVDPNLGSSKDSIKTYCDFDTIEVPRTCVENATSDSQLGYLHLLHTRVSQTIHLPCAAEGPFSLTPFDADEPVDVILAKSESMEVSTSDCNRFTMLREVEFSTENSAQQMLPFTQPIRVNYQDYHFKEICFF